MQSVTAILPLLAKRADLPDPATPLEVWEEIKSEPAVMCERLPPHQSLGTCQLEDGDILCVQVAVSEARPAPPFPVARVVAHRSAMPCFVGCGAGSACSGAK